MFLLSLQAYTILHVLIVILESQNTSPNGQDGPSLYELFLLSDHPLYAQRYVYDFQCHQIAT